MALVGEAHAVDKVEAAQPPVRIGVFVSSRTDVCFDQGDVGAVTQFVQRERERINRQGGVNGRRVDVTIFDDASDPVRSVADVRSALGDQNMLALIGLSNSNRAKAVFDALGKEIGASGIPFLSNISVNSIFQGYRNVFTTQATQDEERLPVMTQFIRKTGISSVAFVGLADNVFSAGLGDGLRQQLGERAFVADHRMRSEGDVLDRDDLASVIADIKAKNPALVALGLGGKRAAMLISGLVAAGTTPALFTAGRIDSLPPEVVKDYPNAMYQLAWDRLPETDNERVRRIIDRDDPATWIFEGRKIAVAPGWKNGECKERPAATEPEPYESANLRAIALGAQFADMVALVTHAARTAKRGTDLIGLRGTITKELTTTYASGRGVFAGSFQNWSFSPVSRAAARTPFIVIQPQALGRTQLAPFQFARTKDGALRQFDTLYADIDLIRAHRVDDNEKTFSAEFYLSLRGGENAAINQIEFTNAFIDPKTNGRQITVEMLHGGGPSMAYPESMKIYKVAGRFTFEPELASYPFDSQKFPINIQPKRAEQPFIVQPPPQELRDRQLETDGWDQKDQYVSYTESFVPLLDAYTHAPSVVPFYQASFVWKLKRQTTDYFLRVVVPLAFILIVAYLSYFISTDHFEAIVTIQVTALLSAVALYLSLPKLDSDAATLSDRIFVFDYMLVSLMIVISILRVNTIVTDRRRMKKVLSTLHVAGIPLCVAAMAFYVWRLTTL